MLRSLLFSAFASFVSAAGTLQGSYKITPQDYYGLPVAALATNPPACSMPYNQLNLARITAVQNMNTASTCNLCLKVVNSENPSKFVHVLAVDLGGAGLDLSIPAFEYIFDQKYDASPASWSTVDASFCAGIYTPGKINSNQGIETTTKKKKHTSTKKHATTTKKHTFTKKHTSTKKKTTVTAHKKKKTRHQKRSP